MLWVMLCRVVLRSACGSACGACGVCAVRCCWWSWCVFGVRHAESGKPVSVSRHAPVCTLKKARVLQHHVNVFFNMSACCRHTRGRLERTNASSSLLQTTEAKKKTTNEKRNHRQYCIPKFANKGSSRAPEVHQITARSYPF